MLDDALRYAAMGWPVLSLRPGGKEPLGDFFPRGVHDATTNERVIRAVWKDRPDANIGIACKRFVVIDIDPRNGGNETMAELVRLHGRLPETPVARTGSGGLHYLFDLPSFELRGQAGPGVDVKKPGGYIVAAPSRTVGPYRWLRPYTTPLATLPSWLQSLVKRSDPPPAVPIGPLEDVTLERRVERARAYLEHVEPAVQGQNGSTRTLVAAAHAARGFALPLEHAFFAMSDWNQRCQPPWNDRDLKRKIDEALRKYEGITPGQHLARR